MISLSLLLGFMYTEEAGLEFMLLTYIQEVLSLNLDQDTSYLYLGFSWFSQSLG
jgi:hypothetical protein